jgi:spoIIIJ-associated protein
MHSGLPTASADEGPRRFVVLYPEGQQPTATPQGKLPNRSATEASNSPARVRAIRSSFRPR